MAAMFNMLKIAHKKMTDTRGSDDMAWESEKIYIGPRSPGKPATPVDFMFSYYRNWPGLQIFLARPEDTTEIALTTNSANIVLDRVHWDEAGIVGWDYTYHVLVTNPSDAKGVWFKFVVGTVP
jgi:hypothetical protein